MNRLRNDEKMALCYELRGERIIQLSKFVSFNQSCIIEGFGNSFRFIILLYFEFHLLDFPA